MLIDAHAHLDKYDDKLIDAVLSEIEQGRILTMSVSIDPASFSRTEAIAARSHLVVPSFGIHPERAPDFVDSLSEIEEMVGRSPTIGEIGLDQRFVTDTTQYSAQREVFATMLDMARDQEKLVNVHCVGAEQESLDMLQAHRIERAIIHWYSGPLEVLRRMIEAGYCFTIGVELLHSDHIRGVASLIPDSQLLTETDNPGGREWLTGKAGRPSDLGEVVDELARLRGVTSGELVRMIRENLAGLLDGDDHLISWRSEIDTF